MERTEISTTFVISKSEPRLYIYPNTKKERISFSAFDMTIHKEISIIANKNVKYYLKRALKPNEMWRLEGVYNQDYSTLYLERATRLFDENGTKEIARLIIDYWKEKGITPELRE